LVFGFGKKYKCETCGAKFSTESELMAHGKMHVGAAQQPAAGFKCDACGMTFKSQAELMEHSKKMHPMPGQGQSASSAQVQQFKCQTCGMAFDSQADLMEHAKRAHPM